MTYECLASRRLDGTIQENGFVSSSLTSIKQKFQFSIPLILSNNSCHFSQTQPRNANIDQVMRTFVISSLYGAVPSRRPAKTSCLIFYFQAGHISHSIWIKLVPLSFYRHFAKFWT